MTTEITVFKNKVHNHAYSFKYYLWLLPHYNRKEM